MSKCPPSSPEFVVGKDQSAERQAAMKPWEADARQGIGMPWEVYTDPPHIQWKHIDGPLMHWAGRLHWLTWGERFMLWFGRTTPEVIAFQRFHRPITGNTPFPMTSQSEEGGHSQNPLFRKETGDE